VENVKAEEGAAYGAAILAGVGAERWLSVDEACGEIVQADKRTEPQDEVIKHMQERYEAYRRMYPAIKSVINR
jgi:xylulokinase